MRSQRQQSTSQTISKHVQQSSSIFNHQQQIGNRNQHLSNIENSRNRDMNIQNCQQDAQSQQKLVNHSLNDHFQGEQKMNDAISLKTFEKNKALNEHDKDTQILHKKANDSTDLQSRQNFKSSNQVQIIFKQNKIKTRSSRNQQVKEQKQQIDNIQTHQQQRYQNANKQLVIKDGYSLNIRKQDQLTQFQKIQTLNKAKQLQRQWSNCRDSSIAISSIQLYLRCQKQQYAKNLGISFLKFLHSQLSQKNILTKKVQQKQNNELMILKEENFKVDEIKIKKIKIEIIKLSQMFLNCYQIIIGIIRVYFVLKQTVNIEENFDKLRSILESQKNKKVYQQKQYHYHKILGEYFYITNNFKKAYNQYKICMSLKVQKEMKEKIKKLCSQSEQIYQMHQKYLIKKKDQFKSKIQQRYKQQREQDNKDLKHKQKQKQKQQQKNSLKTIEQYNQQQKTQLSEILLQLQQINDIKPKIRNILQKYQFQVISSNDVSSNEDIPQIDQLEAKGFTNQMEIIAAAHPSQNIPLQHNVKQDVESVVGMATFYWQDSKKLIYRSSQGSGFFISPTVFITVKHNFYLKSNPNTRCSHCEINIRSIHGNHELRRYRSVPSQKWFESKDYDLGAVILQQQFEKIQYEVQIVNRDEITSFYKDMELTLFGYSLNYRIEDRPDTLKQISAKFIRNQNFYCIYNASTTQGLSGSPIFSPMMNNKRKLIGLHISRNTITNNCKALLFNERMRAQIQSWYNSYNDYPSKLSKWFDYYQKKYRTSIQVVQKVFNNLTEDFENYKKRVKGNFYDNLQEQNIENDPSSRSQKVMKEQNINRNQRQKPIQIYSSPAFHEQSSMIGYIKQDMESVNSLSDIIILSFEQKLEKNKEENNNEDSKSQQNQSINFISDQSQFIVLSSFEDSDNQPPQF